MEVNTVMLPLVSELLDEAEAAEWPPAEQRQGGGELERWSDAPGAQPGSGAREADAAECDPAQPRRGVVMDERGHNVWQGTIETGLFELDDTQWRMRKLAEADQASCGAADDKEASEPLSLSFDEAELGFDPYNSG